MYIPHLDGLFDLRAQLGLFINSTPIEACYFAQKENLKMKSPENMATFCQWNLPASLLESLKKMGFEKPTPIQVSTISPALEGRDIIGTAQTGSGKTAAFSIPIMANILTKPGM